MLPEFQTPRLLLRGVRLQDAPSYQKHFANYAVIRHLNHHVPWPYPENGAREFLESILPKQSTERWTWGLYLKTSPTELIGAVDYWRVGCPENRGFWLSEQHWGQGLMMEATQILNSYAFESLGFGKLILTNAVGNARSRRIKEKSGARYLGTKPAQFVDPKLKETEVWELTRSDWEKNLAESTHPRAPGRADDHDRAAQPRR